MTIFGVEDSPTLTVVTVVRNGATQIAATIESVLAQTYPAIEYVVIDGDSRDGTQAIVRSYGAAIGTFLSEPDGGIYDAMNRGASRARGEYLLFMNCGDQFADTRVAANAMQLAATSRRPGLIVGSWLRRGPEGRHTLCDPCLAKGLFNHQALFYLRALHATHGSYVCAPGLSTADYLFFTSLLAGGVTHALLDAPVALIDTTGLSAGSQTLSQKTAIDFLVGRCGRLRLIAVLVLHPAWILLRRLLRIRR